MLRIKETTWLYIVYNRYTFILYIYIYIYTVDCILSYCIIIVYLISIRNPPRHQPLRMKQQPCITGKDMRKEKECMPFFLVCLSVGPSVCHIFSLSFFLLTRYLYFHLLSFTKAISRLSTLCLSLVLRFFPSLALFMDHLLLFILYIYLFLINTVR